eukprot:TRINITY_DN8321_c0_g1_i1.p1 TRINITY_DN8321_c0_g1~~TRINITY_DN8321_c0_g1_i1.p1  ORF type:complete len:183 (-),score=54.78 TRINITY_DN8321_c0_g1_i1:62-610(-)
MDMMYTVKAVIILDEEGDRVISKYYNSFGDAFLQTNAEQTAFEKNLFQRASKRDDVILTGNFIAVTRKSSDLFLFVVGSIDENEILLLSVLNTLYYSLSQLMNQVDQYNLLENYGKLLLVIDELVDEGIYFESDPDTLTSRVNIKSSSVPQEDQDLDQAIIQGLKSAKSSVQKSSFFRSFFS